MIIIVECFCIYEQKVELLYQDCKRGPSMEQLLLQHKMVEITCPKSIVGWTVRDKKLSVSD